MAAIDHPAIYDDLLDLLAESADARRILAFHLSDQKQARLDELLEKNRKGTLTAEELAELDAYECLEHVVRLWKTMVAWQCRIEKNVASVARRVKAALEGAQEKEPATDGN